jgi:hypothetical protein
MSSSTHGKAPSPVRCDGNVAIALPSGERSATPASPAMSWIRLPAAATTSSHVNFNVIPGRAGEPKHHPTGE